MNNLIDLKPGTIVNHNYEYALTLQAWGGFQSRQGIYGSVDSEVASTGYTEVSIEGRESGDIKIATIEQVNAIKYLVDNDDKIRDAILAALIKELPELREIYEDLIPDINKPGDFKQYIGLANLHIMSSHKEGFAYIGFEFGCEWDEEHGVGVMMHKDRVVGIGQAATSFDGWVTFDDNGTTDIETAKWNEANAKLQAQRQASPNKKPWWKFW